VYGKREPGAISKSMKQIVSFVGCVSENVPPMPLSWIEKNEPGPFIEWGAFNVKAVWMFVPRNVSS
jgi:hypothetical protein